MLAQLETAIKNADTEDANPHAQRGLEYLRKAAQLEKTASVESITRQVVMTLPSDSLDVVREPIQVAIDYVEQHTGRRITSPRL